MEKNSRPSFEKFQCSVCKKPAKFARFAKNKLDYFCNDKRCILISDIKIGWKRYF